MMRFCNDSEMELIGDEPVEQLTTPSQIFAPQKKSVGMKCAAYVSNKNC